MTTFKSPRFSSALFGILLIALLVSTMSGDVQAQQKRKSPPFVHNPVALEYQATMNQLNNLPVAIYAPSYSPYPYPYPYPYPRPYPRPYPFPGPRPLPMPGPILPGSSR